MNLYSADRIMAALIGLSTSASLAERAVTAGNPLEALRWLMDAQDDLERAKGRLEEVLQEQAA